MSKKDKNNSTEEKKIKTDKKSEKSSGKKWLSRFSKKNEVPIILVSLAFSLTLFFFSPIDIFLGNQREFIVSFGRLAVPMLLTALVFAADLCLVLNILLMIHEKLCGFVTSLLFGVLLAGYTQSLVLNSKMAAVTGDSTDYKDNDRSVILNLVLLICIAALPVILTVISWFAKNKKPFSITKGRTMPYISGLICLMQLAGTASSVATADFSKYKKQYTSYLSYEQTTKLSKDGNIVVFLVDRLDSLWMDRIIKEYPDVTEKFEGFTFYQNNVSHNTNTFPSIPQMLTHSMYKGNDWVDYVGNAWEGETVEKKLKENGYDVNLLIDNLTTYGSVAQLQDQCDNINHCDPDEVKFNYLGGKGIIPAMTQLSLSKLSPYMWKNEFINGFGANLSSDFVQYKHEVMDMQPMSVGLECDLKYYDYITSHEFTADAPNKTFSFIHLNGAHDPEQELADLYDSSIPLDRWVTTRGDFEILFYYFDQMKKLGVYDNSTIIVLGDHGRAPSEIEVDDLDGLTSAITTALLVKPAGAENGKLSYDRDSELSLDFFPASILEYAGIDHEEFGISFNDVVEKDLHPDRWLQTFDFGGYGKTIYKTLYKINGDARDFDNWEPQPEHE